MFEKKDANQLIEVCCPICEKVFLPSPGHIYKDKRAPYKRVCSWGCVLRSERLKEEARAKREEKRKRGKQRER